MQHAVLLGRDSWVRLSSRSYRSLPPRPSDQRVFGELELVHHASKGMSVYAIDPDASGGGFHLCHEGAVGVTLSDDPQLLPVNVVRSDGSPALTGHYLVDMVPQPDLPSVEHFVASGRQVLPLVGMAGLEPGGILGVAHAPLVRVLLHVLQHDHRAPNPSSGLSEVSPVSTVTASPLPASASPSPALLERWSSEQRDSFLRVWTRLPLHHLRAVASDLHGTGWTPEAIEQLGDVLCEFSDVFSKP